MSFDHPYLSWWPIPFPFGYSRVPVIAPYWVDFDFRNDFPDSRVYYKIYERSNGSLLQRAVFHEFDRRSHQEINSAERRIRHESSFSAKWMVVITWKLAIPYDWNYFPIFGVRKQFCIVWDLAGHIGGPLEGV